MAVSAEALRKGPDMRPTRERADLERRATAGRLRPFAETVAFVAVWMGLGLLLPHPAERDGMKNLYLLTGAPLTVGFQLLVRRRPLRELWVRDAPPLRLDRRGKIIAGVLLLMPAYLLLMPAEMGEWIFAAWTFACLCGAVGAAYAVRCLRRDQTSTATVAVAAPVGVLLVLAVFAPAVRASPPALSAEATLAAVWALGLYFPVSFVLEEVTFRGTLDSHLDRFSERRSAVGVEPEAAERRTGWPSALFVSALWGLWHLPILPSHEWSAVTIAQLVVVYCALGVPLSVGWRRTGNLAVPALAHTLIEAVPNALMTGL